MTTSKPLILNATTGNAAEIPSLNKLGPFAGGTATGEAMTQDQFSTNYDQLGPLGEPDFLFVTTTDLTSINDILAGGVPFGSGSGSASGSLAAGAGALASNTTAGTRDVAIGPSSQNAGVDAVDNVTIGGGSLQNNIHGGHNFVGGTDAAYFDSTTSLVTDLTHSVILGDASRPKLSGDTYEIVIGAESVGEGSNTAVIGKSTTTSTHLFGNLLVGGANHATLDVSGLTASRTITVPDAAGTLAYQSDLAPYVQGPASATNAVPALFDGTTGKLLKNSTPTGTGNPVLQTSPSLVTPNLDTPSAGTLTNCTGLPIGSGVSGLGSGVATMLGTFSSANIAAACTDETGSGPLVFATSPQFTGPVGFGTPALSVQAIRIIYTATGGVSVGGFISSVTGDANATTSIDAAASAAACAAGSQTVNDMAAYRVNNFTIGSGATVTRGSGLRIEDLSGPTNVYGINCKVSAGTLKYGIFASGTAIHSLNASIMMGQVTLPSGATYNFVYGGGATSPVLGAATADDVSTAGVDNGAGNRELQIQPESGGLFGFGANKFRMIPSANQDVYRWAPTVNTTDGTQTTLATISITASRTYLIEARVAARRTGGASGTADDGGSYVRRGTYTTKSSTVTLMGSVQTIGTDAEDQAGWDVTLTISTTNVLVRVTGATGNNVTWMGDISVQSVAS